MSFRSITLAAIAASALSTAGWAAQSAQAPAAAQAPATAQAPAAAQPSTELPTRANMIAGIDARFAEIDSNKDGSLVSDEIAAAHKRALQQATAVQQRRIEAEFNRVDANKDKQVSLAEFQAAAPAVRLSETPAQMVAKIDTNKDGKISPAEYRVPPLATFDRVDANKDGTLSRQEASVLR